MVAPNGAPQSAGARRHASRYGSRRGQRPYFRERTTGLLCLRDRTRADGDFCRRFSVRRRFRSASWPSMRLAAASDPQRSKRLLFRQGQAPGRHARESAADLSFHQSWPLPYRHKQPLCPRYGRLFLSLADHERAAGRRRQCARLGAPPHPRRRMPWKHRPWNQACCATRSQTTRRSRAKSSRFPPSSREPWAAPATSTVFVSMPKPARNSRSSCTPRGPARHTSTRPTRCARRPGRRCITSLQLRDGRIGTETAKVIQPATQVAGKLDREGDYCLRIRDLTTLLGSPDHIYRVLVRPEIPHMAPSPCNPMARSTFAPHQAALDDHQLAQEGYAGSLALSRGRTPQGVRAFVGANSTVVELAAEASASLLSMPRMLRISGLPVVGEKSGSAFQVAEIPIMVIKQ